MSPRHRISLVGCGVFDVRAFVAGATGYTGREVVRALVEQGAHTVAHVRPDSSQLEAWRDRFAALSVEVDTTAWDPEPMAATLRRLAPTHVFSLLGTTRARAKAEGMAARAAYERIDYGLTALLIDAAAEAGSKPRFVYLSAVGVGPRSRNPYVRARWRAEEHLRASGLPWTIARPSFITGSDRDDARPLERIGAAMGDGMLAIAGALGATRLRDRYHSTRNTELARVLVRVALDPSFVDAVVHGEDLA